MKQSMTLLSAVCLTASMLVPASALEYTIAPPAGANHGKPTSVQVVQTPDGGAAKNEDVSKNAAQIPPAFGTPSSNVLNSGEYLTPDLAPERSAGVGTAVSGPTTFTLPPEPGAPTAPVQSGASVLTTAYSSTLTAATARYTQITEDLYYSGGHLGTLKIPAIGLTVKVYEGTGSTPLAKGAGHFSDTSIWDETIGLAGHNRGVTNHFGKIHTLEAGDTMTFTTKLGTRIYEVFSVAKVDETDRSALAASGENLLVLYTCVRDQRESRWCVQAREIV